MYMKKFANQAVRILTSNLEMPLQYFGTLVEEDENTIILEKVTCQTLVANGNRMLSNLAIVYEDAPTVIINKDKILSCNN